jgi:competence protein ComEC
VKDPLVAPLLAVASGILASRFLQFDTLQLGLALPVLVALTVFAARRSPRFLLAYCLVTMSFFGALLEALHRPGRTPEIDASAGEIVTLSGCVVSPAVFSEGRDQFTVELAPRARARVSWMLREGEQPPDLRYGQRVEFEARIRPTRNSQNPGAFDYQGFLARSFIFWTASIPSGGAVKVQQINGQPGRCGSPALAIIFGLRTVALNRIDKLYAGDPYATGMMEATLIGETGKLERIWTDRFRRTGTYHMLVIDGLHITILAGFLLFLLRICLIPEVTALIFTAAGAWLYALVSGWNAPALRAAGGFTLYVAARYFYRRARFMNLLAAAALVYLMVDPGQLFESGFQLSFLAVAAIGAFAVPVLEATSAQYSRGLRGIAEESRDPRLPARSAAFRLELRLLAETLQCYVRIPRKWLLHALGFGARLAYYAWEIAVVSTAIQVAVALPMAVYFHRISLTGFSANILIVPLLGLVVPIGFVALFTGWQMSARIAEWLLKEGENIADWHTRFEPNWRVPGPPLWLALAFSLSLLLLAWAIRRSRWWTCGSSAVVLTLFTLIFWHPFPPAVHPRQLELTAIDVGQGDSLLVAFPDSKLMLIDGGGVLAFGRRVKSRFDTGEDVVSPYLWTRSIRKIDILVLTHAHDDHAGGLPAIIENFHPRELWTGATPASAAWSAVRKAALAEKTKIVAMTSGGRFQYGDARIEVLSPPADYLPGDSPKNNDSLALRVTYGQRTFLLTGDMEKPMESRLLASGQPVRADVLKVGHHGSNTSSTDPFLDAVAPTFAVISDGFENSFHHPHPRVLARLAAHRAEVLRTDRLGLITVRTDGRRIWVETFGPGQASDHVYPASAGTTPEF